MSPLRRLALFCTLLPFLAACTALQYQPVKTLDRVDTDQGYRLLQALNPTRNPSPAQQDDVLMVMVFSGGGTRAAAFGYGVLEILDQQPVYIGGKQARLLDRVDLVYGVSGGSVLAAYFGLHGADTVPQFERRFLNQNLQKVLTQQVLSAPNWPRLASSQFGRGDLLHEQLDAQLFHGATFRHLNRQRRGPFVVISATDMTLGSRLDFVQEQFDILCVDLEDLPVARAVAASSAVPLVFAPLTLNNHGGNCHYALPEVLDDIDPEATDFRSLTRRDYLQRLQQYSNSAKRPYIHLLDGGLTDNLGLQNLLETIEVTNSDALSSRRDERGIKKIVVINVNAQTLLRQDIDRSADVPGFRPVLDAVINIPIDRNSQETLRRFHDFANFWNRTKSAEEPDLYFVSINLPDLPASPLRDAVMGIPTTFYLPQDDVRNLKKAAAELLQQSAEYRRLVRDLGSAPRLPENLPGAETASEAQAASEAKAASEADTGNTK
ncbi:NTE family protein [Neisseria sp. HSC-16F19]|nr:patatin-like phospholipase family protein [Neisseria sp. HSC-16F19]MCP2040126.1 NTE family protein [Neisseria sp. HSC-16F19]